MGRCSRNKGKHGELELAHRLQELGFPNARRSQQYCGAAESADVIGVPGVHPEVKRCERLNLYTAYEQAVRDSAGTEDIPIVFHRRSRKQWLAVLSIDDWAKLYKTYMTQGN